MQDNDCRQLAHLRAQKKPRANTPRRLASSAQGKDAHKQGKQALPSARSLPHIDGRARCQRAERNSPSQTSSLAKSLRTTPSGARRCPKRECSFLFSPGPEEGMHRRQAESSSRAAAARAQNFQRGEASQHGLSFPKCVHTARTQEVRAEKWDQQRRKERRTGAKSFRRRPRGVVGGSASSSGRSCCCEAEFFMQARARTYRCLSLLVVLSRGFRLEKNAKIIRA